MSRDNPSYYMQIPQENLYIACDDLEFAWDKQEVKKVRGEWRKGTDISEIAKIVDREIDEVFLLLLDQARSGYIEPRKNGILGGI